MSGYTYEDDIQLLADDIVRWAGADARIHEAVLQLVKLHSAEVDALAFEVRSLEEAVTREVTLREAERVRRAQPDYTWQEPRAH